MKEQLELLEELQEIDSRIGKIERDMKAFPAEIDRINEALEAERAIVTEVQETFENHQKEKRDKDDELSLNAQKLKQFEGRLSSIKTNTEYQASLKEIDQSKKQSGTLEEEVLSLMETIEEEKEKLTAAETAFQEKKEKAEAEIKAIEKKRAEEQTVLDQILKERKEKNKIIDPEVSLTYNNLKSKIRGKLLVPVNDGSCSGCFLHIPPQLINDAMKYEKICQCPHCQRILIVH